METENIGIPQQPNMPDEAEMELKVNEIFHKLSDAGNGEPLIALLIGGVAFLKTIHMELLQTGANLPEDLAQVVGDLSAGLVQNNEQDI